MASAVWVSCVCFIFLLILPLIFSPSFSLLCVISQWGREQTATWKLTFFNPFIFLQFKIKTENREMGWLDFISLPCHWLAVLGQSKLYAFSESVTLKSLLSSSSHNRKMFNKLSLMACMISLRLCIPGEEAQVHALVSTLNLGCSCSLPSLPTVQFLVFLKQL